MARIRELPTPEAMEPGVSAMEVCRVFISKGHSYVSLELEAFETKPLQWGYVLADIAGHLAKAFSESGDMKPDDVFRAIEEGYNGRMAMVLKHEGRHLGSRH
jgi:hypothetical protein